MRHPEQLRNLIVVAMLLGFSNVSFLFADQNAHALCRLFGEENLSSNIDAVRQRAAELSPPERYEYLADWVLPSESHAAIRLSASFAPYVSAPDTNYVDAPGTVISPAIDFILTAESTGKLKDLYQRVSQLEVVGEHHERCQMALLGMIQIRRDEIIDAERILNELELRRLEKMSRNLYGRWPETLLLSFAIENSVLREVAAEYVLRILQQQVRVAANSIGHDAWDRYMNALWGRRRLDKKNHFALDLKNWHSVSGCDEKTRALGFTKTHWQRTGRQVECTARHQNDYLLYRIPLQGDYEVECDLTGFGFREGQLVIGGNWLSPHYDHESFEFGNLRGVTRNPVRVDPKLSIVDDWIRYRAVVRDGVCRIYLNGRQLVSEPIQLNQFPWIAIRTMFFSSAKVRDVRITGAPTIPETVEMTSDPSLSGWVRFHLDNIGGVKPDWQFDEDLGPRGGLYARRKDEFAGTFQESLLRYFRPMLEDGTIEYEFYYEPGETHVFPAIDQQAFLLHPDGIQIHWITNGVWDRTGLDPLNRFDTNQPNIPLQHGWNRLQFELTGDVVRIIVNNSPVYSGHLPKNNDRTFGLFHYADQTQVQVRNMTWQGDWPKTLPELTKQELPSTRLDDFNVRSAELPVEFHFDFSKPTEDNSNNVDPLIFSNRSFFLNNPDRNGKVTKTKKGLLMERPPTEQFKDLWIAPDIRIAGDFDLVAEFENLQYGEPTDGSAALSLTVVTQDELTTHARVWHGVYRHPGIDRRCATQAEFNYFRPGRNVEIQFEGVTSEASRKGRMRIMRIGKTYSFMIAEGDSLNYRLIHQQVVNNAETNFSGIRIGMGIHDNKLPQRGLQVLWKKLHVHAETLVGPQ